MATKTAETKPVSLDPQSERFNAAKAQFEAALNKTAQQEGREEEKQEAKPEAKAVVVEEKEAPAEKPAAVPPKTPKPKIKAPVAKEEPKQSQTDKRLEELSKKLDAIVQRESEPEVEDPFAGVRGKLIEKFGEEDSAAILEALEVAAGPQRKRLEQLESLIKEATKNGRAALSKAHQRRLADVYSQLENPKAWKVVNDEVARRFDSGTNSFSTVDEEYDDVVVSLYGEVSDEDAEGAKEDKERELEASRIAASTMTPPSTSAKEKPLSKQQASLEVFKHLFKNPSDKEGAKRLARQLKVDRNI